MKLDKIITTLGQETIEEMDAMDKDELQKIIVQAAQSMKEVKEELEANLSYQRAKLVLQDLTAPMKEVNQRQKARIQYSLHRLSEIGAV